MSYLSCEESPAVPATQIEIENSSLVLRSAQDELDVSNVAALNLLIHEEEGIDDLVKVLVTKHPYARLEYLLFVEDTSVVENGKPKVVSTVMLLPWKFCLGNTSHSTVWSAELGFVGTLPEYRRQGLSAKLTERYFELVASNQSFVMSHIQGIPGFYHRYGFHYCWPLEHKHIVSFDLIDKPAVSDGAEEAKESQELQFAEYGFRTATPEDAEFFAQQYAASKSCRSENGFTVIPASVWRHILEYQSENNFYVMTFNDEPEAVFGVAKPGHTFGDSLALVFASSMTYNAAQALLRHLGSMAKDRSCPSVRLNSAQTGDVAQLALAMGSNYKRSYKWQIKVYFDKYFQATKKSIQEKLASTAMFKDLSSTIIINMYSCAVSLVFNKGELSAVTKYEKPNIHAESPEFRLSTEAATRLVLGDISFDELRKAYPDASFTPLSLLLAKVLFQPSATYLTNCYY